MAAVSTPTYKHMNGWDLIAGTKLKRVNELLKKTPAIPISVEKKVDGFGNKIDINIDVLIHSPTINIKNKSGREVDVTFPVTGTISMESTKFEIPDKPKPLLLIATVQLKQIEALLQDKQERKQTKFDLILDLKSKGLRIDTIYDGLTASELAVLTIALKNSSSRRSWRTSQI